MLLIARIITAIYFLLIVGIIFVADSKSTSYVLDFVGNIPFGDKLGHFFLLGILSALLSWSLNFRRIGFLSLGSLIVAVAAFAEECSQIFVRGRTFDLVDLAADFLGIFVLSEFAYYIATRISGKD